MARADAVEASDMVDEEQNLVHANLGVFRVVSLVIVIDWPDLASVVPNLSPRCLRGGQTARASSQSLYFAA
jgi:hypothetical protein